MSTKVSGSLHWWGSGISSPVAPPVAPAPSRPASISCTDPTPASCNDEAMATPSIPPPITSRSGRGCATTPASRPSTLRCSDVSWSRQIAPFTVMTSSSAIWASRRERIGALHACSRVRAFENRHAGRPGSRSTLGRPREVVRLRRCAMLADSYGRVATDLRVSLTDRCNLRCSYCMPPEGLEWLPSLEQLTDDELVRLLGIAVERLGITEIRFTGGEPILRRGLAGVVARTAALRPRPEISMTTNGIGLARLAGPLHEAGLDRINVSLDTLDADNFVKLARRDRLADVLAGLAAAARTGLAPVKVNAVLMRDINDHEAADLLQFCLDRGYQMRFIEQMPLDAQHGWRRENMVTADEIMQALSVKFTLTPDDPGTRGSAPAETFLVDGGPARVGVIGSVTRPFCGSCDRVRLTADGQVRNCLFAREESDLRTPLRAAASDDDLAEQWRLAVASKLPGHGINDPGFLQPARPMSAIGG